MEEFKLYSISDEYVEWLREDFPNVYSNKVNTMNDMTAGYVKSALDYRALEYRCDLFEQKSSRL
jgi:hypothetical protein